MSKHWKEKADPNKHIDYMSTSHVGRIPYFPKPGSEWVYFVRVCGFEFQFVSLEQVQEAIRYFSKKIQPSTKAYNNGLEHYWQQWYERLPKGFQGGTKRKRILMALIEANLTFRRDR